MSVFISGFSDEIADDFDKQIEVVKSLGMSYISVRGVDGKNIGDYSVEEFKEGILPRLNKGGIKLSSIGSPIGKVFINDEEGYNKQKLMLENLCEMCKLADCKYIRMFSFFIDKEEDFDSYKTEVIDKLKTLVAIAEKYGVILLHENEKDIYGDIARRCEVLFKEICSPNFKAIFDFANFVQCKENTIEAYELLKPYIEYIHIKDASYSVSHNVLCGTGDGKIPEILKIVFESGYDGFLTLEPHLAMFGTLQSLELEEASSVVNTSANITGEQGYEMQYKALKEILSNLNVAVN